MLDQEAGKSWPLPGDSLSTMGRSSSINQYKSIQTEKKKALEIKIMRSWFTGLLWMCHSRTLLHPGTVSVGNTPPLPLWIINQSYCWKLLGEDSECKAFVLGSLTGLLSPSPIFCHSQLPVSWLFLLFLSSSVYLGWFPSPVIWAGFSLLHKDRRGGYPGQALPSSVCID